jgi:hypothetical protein
VNKGYPSKKLIDLKFNINELQDCIYLTIKACNFETRDLTIEPDRVWRLRMRQNVDKA